MSEISEQLLKDIENRDGEGTHFEDIDDISGAEDEYGDKDDNDEVDTDEHYTDDDYESDDVGIDNFHINNDNKDNMINLGNTDFSIASSNKKSKH